MVACMRRSMSILAVAIGVPLHATSPGALPPQPPDLGRVTSGFLNVQPGYAVTRLDDGPRGSRWKYEKVSGALEIKKAPDQAPFLAATVEGTVLLESGAAPDTYIIPANGLTFSALRVHVTANNGFPFDAVRAAVTNRAAVSINPTATSGKVDVAARGVSSSSPELRLASGQIISVGPSTASGATSFSVAFDGAVTFPPVTLSSRLEAATLAAGIDLKGGQLRVDGGTLRAGEVEIIAASDAVSLSVRKFAIERPRVRAPSVMNSDVGPIEVIELEDARKLTIPSDLRVNITQDMLRPQRVRIDEGELRRLLAKPPANDFLVPAGQDTGVYVRFSSLNEFQRLLRDVEQGKSIAQAEIIIDGPIARLARARQIDRGIDDAPAVCVILGTTAEKLTEKLADGVIATYLLRFTMGSAAAVLATNLTLAAFPATTVPVAVAWGVAIATRVVQAGAILAAKTVAPSIVSEGAQALCSYLVVDPFTLNPANAFDLQGALMTGAPLRRIPDRARGSVIDLENLDAASRRKVVTELLEIARKEGAARQSKLSPTALRSEFDAATRLSSRVQREREFVRNVELLRVDLSQRAQEREVRLNAATASVDAVRKALQDSLTQHNHAMSGAIQSSFDSAMESAISYQRSFLRYAGETGEANRGDTSGSGVGSTSDTASSARCDLLNLCCVWDGERCK